MKHYICKAKTDSQENLDNLSGVPKKVHKFERKNLCSENSSIKVLNLDFDIQFVKIGQKLTEL